MKKNSSFKTTFYLGLAVLTVITSTLMLIGYNIFKAVTPNFKKDKLEIYMDTFQPEKEVIHDTVYIDKPHVKSNDTPKSFISVKPKSIPEVSKKQDSSVTIDTIK
jgi:hypothetical protein